jgi:GAF domain-containing protein/HAMP domain-containing protein
MIEKEKETASIQRSFEAAAQSDQSVAEFTGKERRAVAIERMILIAAVLAIVFIGFYVLLYFQTGVWQILVNVAGLGLGIACLVPAHWLARREKLDPAGYWILLALVIVYGPGELVWADATLPATVSFILLFVLVGSVLRPRRWRIWLGTLVLYVIYIFVINQFEPLPRYPFLTLTPVTQFINIPFALAVLWQVVRAFRDGTIRIRLLIAFMAVVLLPALIISVTTAVEGFRSGQRQVINQLESVVALKETEINDWIHSLQITLETLSQGRDVIENVAVFQGSLTPSDSQKAYDWLQDRFTGPIQQPRLFEEVFLMDIQGRAIVSTYESQEGKIHSDQPYFQKGLTRPYVQPLFYSPALGRISVVVTRPLVDEQGQVWGVLAGRATMAVLNEILLKRTGLGETGETYLVGADYAALTPLRSGEREIYVHTQGAEAAIENQANGSALYTAYRDEPVVGVYHWLPELQAALLAEQSQAEVFRGTYTILSLTAGVALVAVLITVIASLFITRSIAAPLTKLAKTATQIAAGDLELAAKVEREDEIGALARAFNSMTGQLRDVIGSLEQRVANRTQRLEMLATLSERLSAILDFEQLLTELVNQVKERFDYYHAHVYILDDSRQNLVMAAGAGQAGAEMKAQGHHIPLNAPTSLVARAARSSEIVWVDDVREAEDWLPNPLLPDTYAEMAVPIILEGQMVGVLDVQEDEIAGLDEGDANLLRSLANQVAVAIRNAHLFAEVEAALARARAAQEQYIEQAWEKVRTVQQGTEYQCHRSGTPLLDETVIAQLEQEAMNRSQVAVVTMNGEDIKQKRAEPRTGDEEIDNRQDSESGIQNQTALVAPIRLQNQTIGTIQLLETQGPHQWDELELALVQTVADQVAQAAENLRLFDETRRRAGREQIIRQITERIRSATNLDELVKIAAEDLGQRFSAEYSLVELGIESNEEHHAE